MGKRKKWKCTRRRSRRRQRAPICQNVVKEETEQQAGESAQVNTNVTAVNTFPDFLDDEPKDVNEPQTGLPDSSSDSPCTEPQTESISRADQTSCSPHRYESSDSSDSDVELIRPRYVKRRRILPATLPVTVSVYSNKVNSCLKLLPKDSSELVQLAEELERVKDSEDLENEGMFVPPAAQPQKSPLYDLTDSEGEGGEPEAACERLRDASPSPPPTPQTPVRKRGRAYNQIRDLDAQLKDLGTDLSPSHRSVTENDLILVGSSPAPELTVKVRRGGELFRINIRMLDPLQNLAQSVASKLGVEASQILLLLRDEELALTQTAQSLSLTVADIIDCVVLSTSSEQADVQSDDTICLQVQGKEKQSHLSITVGKTEPLQSLINQYHAATGLPKRGKVSFMFEGKKLQGKSTAEELGLETDDIIEVWL